MHNADSTDCNDHAGYVTGIKRDITFFFLPVVMKI